MSYKIVAVCKECKHIIHLGNIFNENDLIHEFNIKSDILELYNETTNKLICENCNNDSFNLYTHVFIKELIKF